MGNMSSHSANIDVGLYKEFLLIYEIKNIFDSLVQESSRLGKEALLQENQDNTLFLETLEFLYNPLITTGLSEAKIQRMQENYLENPIHVIELEINDLQDLMEYLRLNNSGKDENLETIANFLLHHNLDTDTITFVKELVTKNLKIGMTAKTINKALGYHLIPEFAPMLASDFTKRQHKLTGSFTITQKLDGIRCLAIKREHSVDLFARSGKELPGLVEIEEAIQSNHAIPVDTVLDGELLLQDTDGMTISEAFRATQRVVRKKGDKTGVKLQVFDIIELEGFLSGESLSPYSERRLQLELALQEEDVVEYLPTLYTGDDKHQVTVYAKAAEDQGFEGVMVNVNTAHYVNKRTDALMKVKSFKTADLLCTSVEEGTNRLKGTLGAITVEYKGGITRVGSGFTDAERKLYWENPHLIVDSIVEVQYFEETVDSTTQQPSLRFPVFITVRDDKTVEDINIE